APVVPVDGGSSVQCLISATAPTTPIVVDVCNAPVSAVLVSTIDSPVSLTCEGTRTYKYTYTDCAGLTSTWHYVYTIHHTSAPVVPVDGASSVQCLISATAPTTPTVVDVCNVAVPAVLASTVDSPNELTCEGTRTYKYTYTDCAGLTSTWHYVYTIHHTSAPVVPVDGASSVQCLISATAPTTPTVVDVCNVAVPAVLASTIDSPNELTCEGTRTYTYTYTDCAGLTSTWHYVYTIHHTSAPVVPIDGGSSVQCLTSATAPTTPTVVDVCNAPVSAVLVSTIDSPNELTCEGTRTYTYTYTDCAGLTSTWHYVYTIHHTSAPVVPVDGGSSVQCLTSATAPTTPVVTDVCGVIVPAVLVSTIDTPNELTCEGTRTYTYTYTDCAGLTSTWHYVYTIHHTSAPVVPIDGGSSVQCLISATTPTTPTVVDVCNAPVSAVLVSTVDSPNELTCEGTRAFTYT